MSNTLCTLVFPPNLVEYLNEALAPNGELVRMPELDDPAGEDGIEVRTYIIGLKEKQPKE